MTTFIKSEDLPVIEKLAASTLTETIRKRVRLLLLYEAGMKTAEIAEKVELSPGRVLYWRRMYLRNGMAVFGDAVDALPDDSESVAPEKRKKKTRPEGEKKQKIKKKRKAKKMKKSKKKKSRASGNALAARIKKATKKRAKLKKQLKGLAKKKATAVRGRMKRLRKRIRKAKKTLKKKRS